MIKPASSERDAGFVLVEVVIALAITAVAFAGKIISGLVAGKVNKWVVGVGMIPRGEVGLIFATTGHALGVVTDQMFSVIVIVVALSTLIAPLILAQLLKTKTEKAHPQLLSHRLSLSHVVSMRLKQRNRKE